jgi:hypothetical protein
MTVLDLVAVSTSQKVYRGMRFTDDEKNILNDQGAAEEGLSQKGRHFTEYRRRVITYGILLAKGYSSDFRFVDIQPFETS